MLFDLIENKKIPIPYVVSKINRRTVYGIGKHVKSLFYCYIYFIISHTIILSILVRQIYHSSWRILL